MNERLANNKIYLLAKEAGLIEFEQLDWNPELVSPTYESVAKSRKFAELIVQECMTLMNNERDYYSKPGSYEPESYYIQCAAKEDAFDEAAILIKHHFGVDENS